MYKVTHTFICKICNAEISQSYQSEKISNPIASLPSGWSQLSDGYVCDNHIITITDKLEESISE